MQDTEKMQDGERKRTDLDVARGVTYLWVDEQTLSKRDPIRVLPIDVPGGHPRHTFTMLQDKSDGNIKEGYSVRAVKHGRRNGKTTAFVRIYCKARIDHHLKLLGSRKEWDALEFLAMDELNLDNRYVLWDLIVATMKAGPSAALHQDPEIYKEFEALGYARDNAAHNALTAFVENPGLIGMAIFYALPNLRLLSWEVSIMGEGLPRLTVLSFANLDAISDVEVYAHGMRFVDVPIEVCMPEVGDMITPENISDYYVPWV